ncbi:pyrroloquinoline quinone biosynthesis protein B [Tenacibaculum sp. MAR_2010_89]|uniref:MBL fold metallo-hydrolase n=1 Tax=Tenacibaculum sp. MAR_2010_89 TaxID=1250198 RepID=UPI00089C49DE|nr:MBL fold metallo-hydrolase [Tenacibaculum sp. MAR_2010_89]SEE56768.1 pyrroloquinoline quinone biosynthesis protein B [Tenacibaculum sp. MAR_2010_89]
MKVKSLLYIIFILCVFSCVKKEKLKNIPSVPYFVVLGVAQDAGYPQIACKKECCLKTYTNSSLERMVSSIGLVDPITNESWMFDATPDFTKQTKLLSTYTKNKDIPDGIFLTHGHIGHYTGIMFLGREAMSATKMPIYTMPRMKTYLETNGPWSQLVTNNNIELKALKKDSAFVLNKRISITPIHVPHRDEYTETVGYLINNTSKKALFIPDVDKWEKWDRNIIDYIKQVDIAFLDATFFKNGEINRDMNEVPHPFVEESMKLFEGLTNDDKKKIYFIHFNHTNPLLGEGSDAENRVEERGFNIAKQNSIIKF